MLDVLVGMALPLVVFGAFALLSMWLGADSRPWFDERPVYDDRPNWWPLARRPPRIEEEQEVDAEPPDATPVPVPATTAPDQPAPALAARAAMSPSGV
jgi:hypothetical protein